jgi:hypothetical protein
MLCAAEMLLGYENKGRKGRKAAPIFCEARRKNGETAFLWMRFKQSPVSGLNIG